MTSVTRNRKLLLGSKSLADVDNMYTDVCDGTVLPDPDDSNWLFCQHHVQPLTPNHQK